MRFRSGPWPRRSPFRRFSCARPRHAPIRCFSVPCSRCPDGSSPGQTMAPSPGPSRATLQTLAISSHFHSAPPDSRARLHGTPSLRPCHARRRGPGGEPRGGACVTEAYGSSPSSAGVLQVPIPQNGPLSARSPRGATLAVGPATWRAPPSTSWRAHPRPRSWRTSSKAPRTAPTSEDPVAKGSTWRARPRTRASGAGCRLRPP